MDVEVDCTVKIAHIYANAELHFVTVAAFLRQTPFGQKCGTNGEQTKGENFPVGAISVYLFYLNGFIYIGKGANDRRRRDIYEELINKQNIQFVGDL